MELSEYTGITQKLMNMLGTDADQGEASNLLADLTQAFSEEVAANATAKAEVSRLTQANDKLKDDNMKLFLRISVPEDNNPPYNPTRPETSTDAVDALFTDNSRLIIT